MIRISQIPLQFCFIFFFGHLMACSGQPATGTRSVPLVGGGCDGCELMYVGMPDQIPATDTSAGWYSTGQRLLVTGTVYQLDGITPAPDVIIYYWQTNDTGYYASRSGLDARAKRHGYIRGWVKTDRLGRYNIYTIRPAPYPGEQTPAHIHLAIKEPNLPNEYYVDELNFDDDPFLIPARKKTPLENRGGSGILRILVKDDLQIGEHDVILGLNIPHYPVNDLAATQRSSGLPVGHDQPSFIPFHAYGPDKGTTACPVCKYGRHYGILYFVGEQTSVAEMKQWLQFLESMASVWQGKLKVYMVEATGKDRTRAQHIKALEGLGKELGLRSIALTLVPDFSDQASEANLNKIDPAAKNTFIVYRNRRIIHKWVNLKAGDEAYASIRKLLTEREGDHFTLPGLPHD